MTTSFHDWAIERDNELVIGLCSAARTKRMELREWIEAELKSLLAEAEMQEPLSDGLLQDQIRDTVKRLRLINQNDLPRAVRAFDDVCSDVSSGSYDSVEDAYDQLESGCMKLVQILKELHEIRTFIGDM